MIRFCNIEVDCIEFDSLIRKEISKENRADLFCVYDNFSSMKYIGIMAYNSIQNSVNVNEAIKKEYVVLNTDIWRNARRYFVGKNKNSAIEKILPVLDSEHRLVCFAYEDDDADREIRMLYELQKFPNIIQFRHFYPEIKCVKIYECNELAYEFAIYLNNLGVAVKTVGALWENLFKGESKEFPDYECMSVFAEGVGEKCSWKDNLLKSVSVEFECIDKIYEQNVVNGNIKNAEGNFSWLIEQLRDEKELIIIGTGKESLNAYDLLLSSGIDIMYFLSEKQEEWNHKLLGKRIVSKREIRSITKKPIFLECISLNSAWGGGKIDRYDYEGYRRNQSYFLLRDYVDIPMGNLQHILSGKDVILCGNLNLCYNVKRILEEIEGCSVAYCDILEENSTKEVRMAIKSIKKAKDSDICFLIEPKYQSYDQGRQQNVIEKRKLYLQKLKETNISYVSEYFSDREVFISIQKDGIPRYTLPWLTPGKILVNISGHMSGNDLFRFILDGHPDILLIDDNVIRNNLYFICMQLAEEKADDILDTFWEIYHIIYQDSIIVKNKDIFNQKFSELLSFKDTFTSQELFVMFYIAYAKIWGTEISDVRNMLLYYEDREESSHEKRTDYEVWLCDEKVKGFSINIIRNAYARMGSFFNQFEMRQGLCYPWINDVWKYMTYQNESKKPPNYWKRFGVKFETLKTIPEDTLKCICEELEISWDDRMLETTVHGRIAEYPSGSDVISGFDLKPVYNLYDEYFSDFDRFRINMIFSEVQRNFGYSYVSCRNFSARQLQEMFLKEFKFENKLVYASEYYKSKYREDIIGIVHKYLRKAYMHEVLQNNEESNFWEDIKMI